MTSTQVVEMSVTVSDNSPFQDYPHPDDHTTRLTVTPGSVKPFIVIRTKEAFRALPSHFNKVEVNHFYSEYRLRLLDSSFPHILGIFI